ncbi:MAG: hypothetical protein ACPLXM_04585 [Bacteroidales bacterium]
MKTNRYLLGTLSVLRILIGWHFLYEGIVKLMNPAWSAKGYLENAYGFLGGFYHSLAAQPGLLKAVDILNEWGLTLIGLGLIFGVLTRLATGAGVLLLLLYYFAYPPFGETFTAITEGNYWIVNKTLLEAVTLIVLFVVPTGRFWGLDYYFQRLWQKKSGNEDTGALLAEEEPANEKRRVFIRNLATLPVFGGLAISAFRNKEWEKPDGLTGATVQLNRLNINQLKGNLPSGKIGDMEISRLIMGCNLIGGWAHARDLHYVSSLFRAYNTEAKIMETLWLAEQAGIRTTFMVNNFYPLFNKFKKLYGSKMKSICQAQSTVDNMYSEIDKALQAGADSIYIQGHSADVYVRDGMAEKLGDLVEYIHKHGLSAGIGAHSIQVIIKSEELGLNADYYVKTFHHDKYWSAHPRERRKEFQVDVFNSPDHNEFHDNLFDIFPEQTAAVMAGVRKPWIAFKVLAGGAIPPKDGFRFAFENGADFICVGMFDFQVVEDVNLVIDVLNELEGRQREWFA